MQISVQSNIREFKRANKIVRDQIPFAGMQAVNSTAYLVQKVYRNQVTIYFDRPTKDTVNGMFVVKARDKRNAVATVNLKPHIAKYLEKQIEGGVGGSTAVPVNITLNAYGNIPGRRGGAVRRLGNKPKHFTPGPGSRLPRGIYKIVGGKKSKRLQMLVAFEPSVKFNKRFPYFRMIQGVVRKNFNKIMHRELQKAIKSAR